MTTTKKIEDAVRHAIISQPDAILDDKDVMHALIAANQKIMGANIVDLRGITMDRLETRLDKLEETHRSVIAAAYENVAGTHQIHRAILQLLDAATFEDVLRQLNGDIAETLRVDVIRVVLETDDTTAQSDALNTDSMLSFKPAGYIEAYLTRGRPGSGRPVTLRQVPQGDDELYGDQESLAQSEACLKLDMGDGRLPGLLVLASQDPQMFGAHQGTDLLVFFAGVFERMMRRWLS